MSCVNALDGPSGLNVSKNDYAWTDLTYLMYKNNVSWAYILATAASRIVRTMPCFVRPSPRAPMFPASGIPCLHSIPSSRITN